MRYFSWQAVYVMWMRDMKRLLRSKSRIFGMLGMPLFFLIFLGMGFGSMRLAGIPEGVDYRTFLAPGMVAMVLLMTSLITGVSVLWDKEYGYLKEILVAPVSRLAIVLGRIAGGVTTALFQALLVLVVATLLGVSASYLPQLPLMLLSMVLLSMTFVGLGVSVATLINDTQAFHLIMNLLTFPMFFLSGVFYPISNFPNWLQKVAMANPMTYGVDALRSTMLNISELHLLTDLAVLALIAVAVCLFASMRFTRVEVDN